MVRARWVVIAALFADTARAAEPIHADATLDYSVPSDVAACPDKDAFTSAVATRLGYDPFAGTEHSSRTMSVRFRRDGATVVADLRLANTSGEETQKSIASESGSCAELGLAAAFAAAILIDPRAMFPRPKPAGGEALDSRSPGTWPWYEPPPLPPQPKPAPAVEPVRLRAGITAIGCVGCAPAPNVGSAVFVGLSKGLLGINLGVRGDLPRSETAAGQSVGSALVLGEVFPHARLEPFRLGVVGAFGALFGDSAGERQVSPWTAAGARLAIEWMIASPVFVRVALDGMFVLSRVSLRVDGGELWSTPSFVGTAGLGAGIQF